MKKNIFIIMCIIIVLGLYYPVVNLINHNQNFDYDKKIISPNGTYIAYTLINSGGATTDFSPQVTLVKPSRFILNQTKKIFVGYHSNKLEAKWQDNNTLIIYTDYEDQDILKKEDSCFGVNIIYSNTYK